MENTSPSQTRSLVKTTLVFIRVALSLSLSVKMPSTPQWKLRMSPKEVPHWKRIFGPPTARRERAMKRSDARGDNKRADDSLEEVLAVEAKVRAKMKGNKKKTDSWTKALYALRQVSCLDDRGLPFTRRFIGAPRESTGSKAPRVQLATKAQRTAAPWITAEFAAKKAADAAAAAAKSDDA